MQEQCNWDLKSEQVAAVNSDQFRQVLLATIDRPLLTLRAQVESALLNSGGDVHDQCIMSRNAQ